MSSLQIIWIAAGLIFGLFLIVPIKRCKATHNGICSFLMASLMGILNIGTAWIAVVIGLICFSYGLYQNQHKYIGVTHHDSSSTTE